MALQRVCRSEELLDGRQAVPFDVLYDHQPVRAFAVRHAGRVYAYLNRCTHVAMEMDWQPGRFFDDTGQWLLCASHGAAYAPDTGECVGGPCRGGLVAVPLTERDGVVYWRAEPPFERIEFWKNV